MAFPNNPSNGDTFVRYGRTYQYDSAMLMWKVLKSGILLEELADIDITTNPPTAGDALLWSGSTFEPGAVGAVKVYQTNLPLSGNSAGDIAYITDLSRLYMFTGVGWFNIALINTNPTITTGPDGSYTFAPDGTPTVITLVAEDPEGLPITWSYSVTSGVLGSTATLSQVDNVFTLTPSTNVGDAGEFSITFTASDGINLATATSSFKLQFSLWSDFSAVTAINSGTVSSLQHDPGTINPRAYFYSSDGMYQYYSDYATAGSPWIRANTVAWSMNAKSDGWSTPGQFFNTSGAAPNGLLTVNFADDGTKAIMLKGDTSSHIIYKYETSTPWDWTSLSSRTAVQQSASITTDRGTSYAWLGGISEDGLYVSNVNNDNLGNVYVWKMTTPWDLSTIAYYGTIEVAGANQGVYTSGGMLPNGTGAWNYAYVGDKFYFRRLSTPWDLTSAGPVLIVQTALGHASAHASLAADGSRIVGMRQVSSSTQYQRLVTFVGLL